MLSPVHSLGYTVYFNANAYRKLNAFLKAASYSGIYLLVDEHTYGYCLPLFYTHIEEEYAVKVIKIKAGEPYKNIETCLDVWHTLSRWGADRKSLLIALGGGVVTDLGGFVASTYMRGIDFINMPTSLLAMVDAAIGGKTGVDLGVLKNLVGVINIPKMVVVDTSFLKTLPLPQLRSGLAEMLKHGLISDESYWNALIALPQITPDNLSAYIHTSVVIKNKIVIQDPTEKHLRKVLNYGHTLGHAIESYFLTTPHPLLHGQAVAIGIVLATHISSEITGFPKAKCDAIKKVVFRYFEKVPIHAQDYSMIISLLKHDKKNTHGIINFVLLEDIAKPVFDKVVSEECIITAFKYYMENSP